MLFHDGLAVLVRAGHAAVQGRGAGVDEVDEMCIRDSLKSARADAHLVTDQLVLPNVTTVVSNGNYLSSAGLSGGPAAILAKNNIRKVELLEYPELGMEAIWKIERCV